jgi:hypothetical protein
MSNHLFLIKTLNKKTPQDCQYIYLALGGDHVFHKELMIAPMDHLHHFQELLHITKKLPADDQICQSTRCEMRGELEKWNHDKMSRYTYSRDKRQNRYNKRRCDNNSKRVASTKNCEWYNSHRPKKDSHGDCKAPLTQNDKDFKPCLVHGAEPSIHATSAVHPR